MADEPEVNNELSGGETAEVASQEAPEQSSPEEPAEAEQPDQSEVEDGDEGEVIKSERGQRRVQQLANERNQLKSSLRDITATGESRADSQQQTPPWMQASDPLSDLGDQVTPEQYRQHVIQQAETLVELKLAQKEQQQTRIKNLDDDINYLEKQYPELAGELDGRLANSLERAKRNYQLALKADPDVRLKDFVEPIMEARTGGAEKGKSEASSKLAEQSSQAAVTPGTQKNTRVSSEDQLAEMLAKGEITAKEAAKRYPDLLPSD